MDFNQKRPKLFYGWYVVGACLLITLYTGGIVFFGFTAVFEPIAGEFGWSYAQISFAASLRGLEVGLLAPVMGFLVDRWGPRRLVFGGSILVCAGLLVLSRVTSLAMFYGAFALIAIGISTTTSTVLMTAVANWFRRRVGLAVGIAASGIGLGGLIVPLITHLIDVLQWRMVMVIAGLGMLVVVLPLSLVIRHKPEHYGYQPDGEEGSVVGATEGQVSTASAEPNIPTRQAVRSRAFWHIGSASMCHAFVIGAAVMHVMPYLSSLGVTRSLSSLVALVLPVTSIVGRLGGGGLVARFSSRKIYTASFISMTIGLLLFGYVADGMMWLLIPFVITFSLGWGSSITTRITLQREYFGTSSFGTILGLMSFIMMLGMMAGAPLAGLVFDIWGSYKGAWLGFSAITLAGSVLAITMPPPQGAIRQSD